MTEEKKPLIQAAAFWIKEKNGKKYMTGKIDGVPVIVFTNKYKKAGDSKPDRVMYWQDTPPKWFVDPNPQKSAPATEAPKPIQEDDIPW